MPHIITRPATNRDAPHLPAIERSAASRFSPTHNPAADPALAWIANAPVMTEREFVEFCGSQAAAEGRWLSVAVVSEADRVDDGGDIEVPRKHGDSDDGGDERLVGFIAFKRLDGAVFIAEMSVAAEWQGCGVGGKLIEAAQAIADDNEEWESVTRDGKKESKGMENVTYVRKGMMSLTTDRFVAWNAPFYARRGFVEIDADMVGVKHVEVLREEGAEKGLDSRRRCCMVRMKRSQGKWADEEEVLRNLRYMH